MSRDQVRVRQPGGQQPLLVEPRDDLSLTGPTECDHLDGHQALQAELARFIDDAHAAAAGLAQDLIAREIREDDRRKREGGRETSGLPSSGFRGLSSAFQGDGRGGAVGDQAQPHQDLADQRRAEEDCQDADDLSAVDQRVAAEATNAFPAGPLGRGQPRRVRLKVGDLDRLSACGDETDLAHPEGDAPVAPVKPRPVALLAQRPAGAGDEVQAGRLVGALRARGAGCTLVARSNQPDPCQGDVGALERDAARSA